MVYSVESFTAYRQAVPEDGEGARLLDIHSEEPPIPNVSRVNSLRTTHISSTRGRRAMRFWSQTQAEETIAKLKKTAGNFPKKLEGFIGQAVMLGEKSERHRGPKYVGYGFNEDLTEKLRRERYALMRKIHGNSYNDQSSAHISLFKTHDYAAALALVEYLDEQKPAELPVILSRLEVVAQ